MSYQSFKLSQIANINIGKTPQEKTQILGQGQKNL